MKIISLIVGVVLFWFSGAQLFGIAGGILVQDATFYSVMIMFLTSITLVLSKELWVVLVGLGIWILIYAPILTISKIFILNITRGKTASGFIIKSYYLILILTCLYVYLNTIARANNWAISSVMITGYSLYLLLHGLVFLIGSSKITKEDRKKHVEDMVKKARKRDK
ncbi:MAG: hypothetical protein NG740_03050 [Omnitrophica bacterium]|nr:hypothetical protein [Candidatus Omnitrophota bacterium]